MTRATARSRVGARVMRGLAVAVGLAWCVGAVRFLSADGHLTWTMPVQAPPPEGEFDVASYLFGPTVSASSYFRDRVAHNHPAFLVDGRNEPGRIAKWVSDPRDRAPWVEIHWRAPRTLSRVVLSHAGPADPPGLISHRYRLRCLGSPDQDPLVITANTDPIATHPLACKDALGLRIDWPLGPGDGRVRLYEVEAWGQ